MWPKAYRDYPVDRPLMKYQVAPGKGIIGCEMHELNGWGGTYHMKDRKMKTGKSVKRSEWEDS